MHHNLLVQAKNNDPMTWVMIGVGAFVLIYLAILRPMMRGKKGTTEPPSARPVALGQQRALERDMQNVLVEYEQMIRNMTAGLDTRAAKLEQLLREADEKLAEMRTAAAGAGMVGGQPLQSNAGSINARVDEASLQSMAAPASPGPDPRHAEVYALFDEGLSAPEVARRLGRPNGEVELIKALRGEAKEPRTASG